jgi:hypothetical protein
MYRRHDETTGKWFDEDTTRCSRCYLNHGHTHAQHMESIASQEIAREMNEPLYRIRASATLFDRYTLLRGKWYADNQASFRLYDTSRG